jgi:putative flippase GtrA
MPDAAQLLRYCVVGGINTAIGFSIIVACMSGLGMPPPAANAAGLLAGYLLGYTLHRRYTFRSTVAHGRGLPAFLAVTAIGYAANMAVLLLLIANGIEPILAQAIAILTYVALTFVLNATVVFGRNV